MITFAGVIIAVVLRALARHLRKWVPLSEGWCYVIVVCAIVAAIFSWCYFLGPRIVQQGHEIVQAVPGAIQNVRSSMDHYTWGRDLNRMIDQSVQRERVSGLAKSLATNTLDGITDAVIILAVALFIGANPEWYKRGLLFLVPPQHKQRTSNVLATIASCMTGWLLGQLVPMAVLGVGSMIGLWILGVPLAFTLGMFTGLMLFIPYVGSVLSYIPTALIAFTVSPVEVVYVTMLYIGVHVLEGYVITPISQKHAVKLPPAVTLLAQFFMWKVAGLLGVVVATPLTAAVLATVQKLKQNAVATESNSPD